jgi:hypothetical protein
VLFRLAGNSFAAIPQKSREIRFLAKVIHTVNMDDVILNDAARISGAG